MRNDAIKKLEDANPDLTVAYCLPVLPSGLDYNGINVIEDAVGAGVRIDIANIMAMDYGDYAAPNPSGKMGDYDIEAAGTYVYYAVLCNDAGSTKSSTIIVSVN